jgi:hypothetical protein
MAFFLFIANYVSLSLLSIGFYNCVKYNNFGSYLLTNDETSHTNLPFISCTHNDYGIDKLQYS